MYFFHFLDRVAEYSDEDEEGEFSSGEENDDAIDLGIGGYTDRQKNNLRKYSEFFVCFLFLEAHIIFFQRIKSS